MSTPKSLLVIGIPIGMLALLCVTCYGLQYIPHQNSEDISLTARVQHVQDNSKQKKIHELSPLEQTCAEIIPSYNNLEFGTISYEGKTWRCLKANNEQGITLGYIYQTNFEGYQSIISVLTGISPSGTVLGVRIASMHESSSVGSLCNNLDWLKQFQQKQAGLTLKVPKHNEPWNIYQKNLGNQEIAAISGATVTSDAIAQCVEQALELHQHHDAFQAQENNQESINLQQYFKPKHYTAPSVKEEDNNDV